MNISTAPAINPAYLDEFTSRFEQLSGKVYRCSSVDQVVSVLDRIIGEKCKGLCYYTNSVLELIQEKEREEEKHFERVPSASEKLETMRSALKYDPKDNINGLDIIKQADIGITTADFGVAEAGCVVEIAYSDSTKLLSSLSRIHIVLLKATNILGRLAELAPILRNVLSKDNDKPTVTLISGPSRTSDIEMKFVLG